MSNQKTKVYAVTGVDHGSIIMALNKASAKKIFQSFYNAERVLLVKDISNYNLENL